MSKPKLILLICLLVGLTSFISISQEQGKVLVLHQKGLKEAFKKAKKNNKLIFILVTSKDCGTCKDMHLSIKKGGDYVDFYNQHFYNFEMEADNIYNQMKLQGWGITKVPSMLFLNGDHKVVHIAEGYEDTSGFQLEADKALLKAKDVK